MAADRPPTLEQALANVREAWRRYQADSSKAGRADVPSLADYWAAVNAVPSAVRV